MLRVFAPGLLGLVMFLIWVFAVLDVIGTDQILMRNLPKATWLFVVIFVQMVGAVAWLALGRPIGAGFSPGVARPQPNSSWQQERGTARRRPQGAEDRDDWSSSTSPSPPAGAGQDSTAARERRLLEWEAELTRREDAIGHHDANEPDSPDSDDPTT